MKVSMKFESNILLGNEQLNVDCLYFVTKDGTLYGIEFNKNTNYDNADNIYNLEDNSAKISRIDDFSTEEILIEDVINNISKIDEIPVDFTNSECYEKYRGKTIHFTIKSLCFEDYLISEQIINNFKNFEICQ